VARRIVYHYGGNLPPLPDSEDIGPDSPVPQIGDTLTRLGAQWVVENLTTHNTIQEGQETLTQYLLDLARVD
jgi:hypothetical protein